MAVPDEPPTGSCMPGDDQPRWPRCPGCGARRLTRCPVCYTAGVDFAWADPAPDGTPIERIICPTCDEVFAPRYARQCEWCGHGFAEGYEPPAPPGPREPVNRRAVAVTLAILAAAAAVVVYLAWLL
ncbi:MAG: hypothetical protein NUV77_03450 [Thermoguttaceae bacterium]|nr:hypothetical protein [Thermoguttaceae bacterium]